MSIQARDNAARNYLGEIIGTSAGSLGIPLTKPTSGWFYWGKQSLLFITDKRTLGPIPPGGGYFCLPLKYADYPVPKIENHLIGCDLNFNNEFLVSIPKKYGLEIINQINSFK